MMVSVRPVSATRYGGAEERFRVAMRYALAGDLRYISHHDELRMLTRALLRAGWPLRYSQGFNPLPRVRLPLPRSVGMASECQWALVELREPRTGRGLADTLTAALPPGVHLQYLVVPAAGGKPHARTAEYALALEPAEARRVAARLPHLLARADEGAQWSAVPQHPPQARDSRAYIETLVLDGPVLRMRLRYHQQRSTRPPEILTELGLDADVHAHRVRRTEVVWDMELAGMGATLVAPKGTKVGQEDSNQQEEENQEQSKKELRGASRRRRGC